jgi:hypothetical protein
LLKKPDSVIDVIGFFQQAPWGGAEHQLAGSKMDLPYKTFLFHTKPARHIFPQSAEEELHRSNSRVMRRVVRVQCPRNANIVTSEVHRDTQ